VAFRRLYTAVGVELMSSTEFSVPAVLAERARERPDECGYTFIDYEADPAGYSSTLTWSEVHRQAQVVAAELASCGSPGDRVAICAPQGFEYIVGFLGTLVAGFIAVPLSAPLFGAHDERLSAALKDSSPVAILTTSAVVSDVDSYARALPRPLPTVIEIDALDLDAEPGSLVNPTRTKTALLQYTSGSTRQPTGVVVTHKNIITNFGQVIADHFGEHDWAPDSTIVSWLPFYHDMGLLNGIVGPVLSGVPAVLTTPVAFLQKPARWMQLLASNGSPFSGGPNFAFELVVRRTSDEDMAGLDLGHVQVVLDGAERVHGATIKRFMDKFSRFNFPAKALRPSYGLAEAMVYVSSSAGKPPTAVRFDYEKLTAGHATRCGTEQPGSELVSHGAPRACTVRIVDPETRTENPAGKVGEIWVHGDNVAGGYWRNPELSEKTFGGQLVNPSAATPQGPWLRTGDVGVISDGELFIIGRIKDLLIVDGRNHYPDDLEATIQEITGGRVAAISVPNGEKEQLVAIVELKQRGGSDEEILSRLHTVKHQVTHAISESHGLRLADLVLVAPGSIPITTSGKIRRATAVEYHRRDEFARLDATE
jgi:long-chain fatty acid adenylase/transferase FadD26